MAVGLLGSAPLHAGQRDGGFGVPQQREDRPPGPGPESRPPDPQQTRMQEQLAKSRNDERQRKLVSDTAKLYELASQLKDQVAKSDKNTLSVDVMKKAEEIERLAKSVKEKMRG